MKVRFGRFSMRHITVVRIDIMMQFAFQSEEREESESCCRCPRAVESCSPGCCSILQIQQLFAQYAR